MSGDSLPEWTGNAHGYLEPDDDIYLTSWTPMGGWAAFVRIWEGKDDVAPCCGSEHARRRDATRCAEALLLRKGWPLAVQGVSDDF